MQMCLLADTCYQFFSILRPCISLHKYTLNCPVPTKAYLPADVEHVLLQGAQAHAAGVLFPSDDDTLHRTILIANINPLINTEQVSLASCLLLLTLTMLFPADRHANVVPFR